MLTFEFKNFPFNKQNYALLSLLLKLEVIAYIWKDGTKIKGLRYNEAPR